MASTRDGTGPLDAGMWLRKVIFPVLPLSPDAPTAPQRSPEVFPAVLVPQMPPWNILLNQKEFRYMHTNRMHHTLPNYYLPWLPQDETSNKTFRGHTLITSSMSPHPYRLERFPPPLDLTTAWSLHPPKPKTFTSRAARTSNPTPSLPYSPCCKAVGRGLAR